MLSGLNEQDPHISLNRIINNMLSTQLARGKTLAQEAWEKTYKRSYLFACHN